MIYKFLKYRTKQYINLDELPKHTIFCSCRKCEPSFRTYYRKMNSK